MTTNRFDVMVIGEGHAGCEAIRACARMGHKTLYLDSALLIPCNPTTSGHVFASLI